MKSSRRQFLAATGGSAAGGALAMLLQARRSVADEIASSAFQVRSDAGVAGLRRQYSLSKDVTYLNHAAIGAVANPVRDALVGYLEVCESNPWLYMWGDAWDQPREEVRNQLATLVGCGAEEIAITHNTTELFNTLAHGLPLGSGDEVLFSSLNHSGASVAFEHMAAARGFTVRKFEFPMDQVDQLTSEKVVKIYQTQIKPQTKMLVLPHIDNTIGLRHPVKELTAMARSENVKYVAVDGAQSVGTIDVDVRDLGVDAYATSSHKWLGSPKGLGVAYIAKTIQSELRPMWVTWGQKSWADSARKYEDYGTRNLAELLALGDAVTFHQKIKPADRKTRFENLWKHTLELAAQTKGTSFNSPVDPACASPVMSIKLDDADSNQVAKMLFKTHKIVVRPFKTKGQNLIRVSPNIYNSFAELERFFGALPT